MLRAPTGYTGIYSTWNLDLDGVTGTNDNPWDFGADYNYPTLRNAGGKQQGPGPVGAMTATLSAGDDHSPLEPRRQTGATAQSPATSIAPVRTAARPGRSPGWSSTSPGGRAVVHIPPTTGQKLRRGGAGGERCGAHAGRGAAHRPAAETRRRT